MKRDNTTRPLSRALEKLQTVASMRASFLVGAKARQQSYASVAVGDCLTESNKLFSSLNEEHTLLDAMIAISKYNHPFIIVEDAGHHPAGLVTSLDVIKKISLALAENEADVASALSTRLKDITSPEVFVVDAKTSMEEAVRIMCSSPHQHMPVTGFIGSSIDDDTRWQGVISAKDLLQWTMNQHQ